VNQSAAGTASLSLRYANGTGATMTLSLYAGGSKVRQLSLPATANWDTWATATEQVPLVAGSNSIAYRFDSTDSGNVNLDSIVVGPVVGEAPAGALERGSCRAAPRSVRRPPASRAGDTSADSPLSAAG
jgi:hypothetical protein